MSRDLLQPIAAGVLAPLVGFASTFALVLSGLRAVGADQAEAASGLMALCLALGIAGIWLGLRERIPVAVAWSTPGAALLISAGPQEGGWPAAVGAFLVAGLLTVLAGLWGRLERAISAIPASLAAAMLAGVLLPVCIGPVEAVAELPGLALPVIAVWAVLMQTARLWAVPAAVLVAAAAVILDGPRETAGIATTPSLSFTAPEITAGAVLGLGIPLFLVTMASQNVPGISVLRTFGYEPRLRPALLATGGASLGSAPFGGHAINLAAITAALVAGPDAHPRPERRWVAAVSGGVTYLVLGLGAGLATVVVAASPEPVVDTVAGLALVGALAASLALAMADEGHREAAVLTLVVSASSVTLLSVSAPFWGLVAGLAYLGLRRLVRRRSLTDESPP